MSDSGEISVTVCQCQYFVKRKNRFCRMQVKAGQKYCGEHMLLGNGGELKDEEQELKRIPCPNDNKHSVYIDKLQKHLKVCNARKKPKPPYIVLDVNRGHLDNERKRRKLSELLPDELIALILKVKSVYEKCGLHVRKAVLGHEVFLEELQNPEYGPKKIKHLTQNASLLRHSELAGFCENETAFVEFGAGKGQMSYYIAQTMQDGKNCLLLLIDRASQKHKLDNKLKERQSPEVLRLHADIADLSLKFIDQLHTFKRIVTVSKHLCGSATDYALRCLIQHELPEVSFTGILIAFCCHHRCDWGSYTGKSFMIQNEFTPEDFDVLCCLASWATCGFGRQSAAFAGEANDESSVDATRSCPLDLSDEERKIIGRKVKFLINTGRQRYLEDKGFTCEQVEYVGENISPENVCILARRTQ